MAINLSPRVGIIVGALQAGMGALMLGSTQFTTLFGDTAAAKIVAGIGLVFAFCGAVTAFLSSAASSQPGPLATPDPASVIKAQVAFDAAPSYVQKRDLAEGAALAKTPPAPPTA